MSAALLGLLLLAASPAPRRAVLVGSNAAVEGRAVLKFAHADVEALAQVLTANGGFAANDVVTLLDPEPAVVLTALETAAADLKRAGADGLLLFYYSGHADQRALFPGGEALPLDALRARLVDPTGVRIGIIDACRGGGWTQAKGLVATAGFDVGPPPLGSEGLALIAASSGLEDAHEAETLRGSFFTHHFVAGLRGAADTSRDGQVTLHEAFTYANQRTIRDTATRAREPQHPSFDFRLHGRQDVVLASLNSGTTALVLAQTEGPLEVVQLSTGITVVEATPGAQLLRLSLPPGPYLVRRFEGGQVHSREVQVALNTETRVEEASLTLVGAPVTGAKGVEKKPPLRQLVGILGLSLDHESGVAPQVLAGLGGRHRFWWRLWGEFELGYAMRTPGEHQQHGMWGTTSVRLNIFDALFTPHVDVAFRLQNFFPNQETEQRLVIAPMVRFGIDFNAPRSSNPYTSGITVGLRTEGSLQKVMGAETPFTPSIGLSLTLGASL